LFFSDDTRFVRFDFHFDFHFVNAQCFRPIRLPFEGPSKLLTHFTDQFRFALVRTGTFTEITNSVQCASAPQESMDNEQGTFDDDFADSTGKYPRKKGGNNYE